MTYLEVMYASQRVPGTYDQVRVGIDRAATLRKTGVLFMIISAETTARLARRYINAVPYRRAREMWGKDNYAVLHYVDGGSMQAADVLWGWDDKSFAWVTRSDPHGVTRTPDPYLKADWQDMITWPPWLPAKALIFTGATLSMAGWKTAIAQFNADMH